MVAFGIAVFFYNPLQEMDVKLEMGFDEEGEAYS